ncbi:hypothetical protein CDAR_198951 [Caerostris darwini]|uniref:Uncharacterized protein n=1 Tax=Caerostris darwini TaxID=1538125 RepID=A0AAV4TDS3_9ARAC|nr:hypothetical protein CDAR_198951 [Caerostris darwini]
MTGLDAILASIIRLVLGSLLCIVAFILGLPYMLEFLRANPTGFFGISFAVAILFATMSTMERKTQSSVQEVPLADILPMPDFVRIPERGRG